MQQPQKPGKHSKSDGGGVTKGAAEATEKA
jgi:chromosome segregation ATPase